MRLYIKSGTFDEATLKFRAQSEADSQIADETSATDRNLRDSTHLGRAARQMKIANFVHNKPSEIDTDKSNQNERTAVARFHSGDLQNFGTKTPRFYIDGGGMAVQFRVLTVDLGREMHLESGVNAPKTLIERLSLIWPGGRPSAKRFDALLNLKPLSN